MLVTTVIEPIILLKIKITELNIFKLTITMIKIYRNKTINVKAKEVSTKGTFFHLPY